MSNLGRGQYIASVIANFPLCRDHFRLVLRLPRLAPTEPGQFVQILCHDPDHDYLEPPPVDSFAAPWDLGESAGRDGAMFAKVARPVFHDPELCGRMALLRRPFSLAGRRDTPDGVEIDIIHRIVGVGTDWLSRLRPTDSVSVLGPLGNRFTLPEPGKLAILVGGGVGIPPMLYLAERLAGRRDTSGRVDPRAVAFSGATTRQLLPLRANEAAIGGPVDIEPTLGIEEFARCGIPSIISTDDGSLGYRGFVTAALEHYLDRTPPGPGAIVYTCGPEPMMRRVAEIAIRRGLACQVAVERAMACGMGTCQSCVIRVKSAGGPTGSPRDGVNRLACTDGPVFAADTLLW